MDNLIKSVDLTIEEMAHDFGRPYLPERNYKTTNYKPIGPSKCHFCTGCKDYYKKLYHKGITSQEFPLTCVGDISQHNNMTEGMSEEELDLYSIYADPVAFAKAEFDWTPRWYQAEMLRCSAKNKVVRAGRRSGKSEVVAIQILYLMYVNSNYQILVVCPYQSQVDRVFEILRKMIGRSVSYKDSVLKDNSSPPQFIKLQNGSQVKGFSSGAKSGGKSNQIRGQDANAVFLDEMDYLGDDDLESIMAILASHKDCKLWASSTPTGARNKFFDWCTNKSSDIKFKEFHFVSAESPNWTDETERFFRSQYSDGGFLREFLAEFGQETAGVYKNSDINMSLYKYTYKDCAYNPYSRYIIGVDWNQNAGTHMVVVECLKAGDSDGDIRYRVVDKSIISRQEFTQLKSVEEVLRLYYKWSADFIYVDAGYGATQVEMLRKFAIDNPKLKLQNKIKDVQMGGNIIIKDPVTKEEVKKPAKAFMVGISAKQLESGLCMFPENEDTNAIINEEGETGEEVGLVQQMRILRVEKIGKSGQPTFSQDCDHTLTAWQLCILGFFLELSDVRKMINHMTVRIAGQFGQKINDEAARDLHNKAKELKKKLIPGPRSLEASNTLFHQDLHSSLKRDKVIRGLDIKERKNRGFLINPKPGKRSSF